MARSRQIRVDPSFERQLSKMKRDMELKKRRKVSMPEFTRKAKVKL